MTSQSISEGRQRDRERERDGKDGKSGKGSKKNEDPSSPEERIWRKEQNGVEQRKNGLQDSLALDSNAIDDIGTERTFHSVPWPRAEALRRAAVRLRRGPSTLAPRLGSCGCELKFGNLKFHLFGCLSVCLKIDLMAIHDAEAAAAGQRDETGALAAAAATEGSENVFRHQARATARVPGSGRDGDAARHESLVLLQGLVPAPQRASGHSSRRDGSFRAVPSRASAAALEDAGRRGRSVWPRQDSGSQFESNST